MCVQLMQDIFRLLVYVKNYFKQELSYIHVFVLFNFKLIMRGELKCFINSGEQGSSLATVTNL